MIAVPANSEFALQWEEGDVNHRAEHFRLYHGDVPDRPVALVGPREPVGLLVRFSDGLPADVLRDVRDELQTWCTPQVDNRWFPVDLWHHLAEYALDEDDDRWPLRWELVPRRLPTGSERPFVEDVTTLFKTWMEHAGARESCARQTCVEFMRDYISLFAVEGGEHRQVVGRLARFVRLQTGADPTARLEVSLNKPGNDVAVVRLERIEDINFAHAWVCMPFHAVVITKLNRTRRSRTRWSRGEVKALMLYIDQNLASEVPCTGLMARADGPTLTLRFCDA